MSDAREVAAKIARTVIGVVRSMQAPDDLPPKSGEKRETKMEETPQKTVEVTLGSHADWGRLTVTIELTDGRNGNVTIGTAK